MTFNSLQYALFLPVVWSLYWLLPRGRNVLLLFASYLFYGAWDYRFLGLLILSTVVDYFVGLRLHALEDDRSRRVFLTISLLANLGILAIFKYSGFFIESAVSFTERLGLPLDISTLKVALPVGISFYTFQTISYTIDVYRRDVEPCRSFLSFALFIAYFPHLVAGPIQRAHQLIPQLEAHRSRPSLLKIQSGIGLIILGLFKKVAIADQVAPIVQNAFTHAESAGTIQLLVGIVAFGVQIYGDFSGYADIARGSSRLFGIELMHNFAQPYLSRNITEFWQRWHISLSTWLRDYLYVPLGGNRGSRWTTYRNLTITMLLGGLWHGASWTFVVWGGLHGVYLAAHRALAGGRATVPEDRVPKGWEWAGVLWTLILVHIAWVFFRAPTFEVAADYLLGILSLQPGIDDLSNLVHVAIAALVVLTIDLVQRAGLGTFDIWSVRPVRLGFVYGVMLVAIIVMSGGEGVPFIYFRF